MSQLINNLILKGYLQSDLVTDAFSEIQRIEFIPEDFHNSADADIPFPIGFGQCIPQPQIVATMLELLDVQRGMHILEIGSGSGWVTALLAFMVGKKGKVTSLESSEELLNLAKENVDKYQFVKRGIVDFFLKKKEEDFPKEGPYDRVVVNIPAKEISEDLKEQVREKGVMVIPLYNDLWRLEKQEDGSFKKDVYSGFSFMPLQTKG
ncbi:MAG: methyltransferase domain-containing protein [Candidatus Moranbacteria bacterium]|nr:methyltransferase domain-containing protein [Candidatus Moranbacteria bacterium]